MKNILFLLLLGLLASCNNTELEKGLEEANIKLAEAQAKIAELENVEVTKVVHSLYFTLKEEATPEDHRQFVGLLKQLGELSYVSQIKIGTPADVPDPRVKKDYDYAMEMQFVDKDALNAYQQDSTHLRIRGLAGPLLGGPPLVYDFEVLD